MTQEPSLVIQAHNLTRSLPIGDRELPILKGVSFAIARGEWVALM